MVVVIVVVVIVVVVVLLRLSSHTHSLFDILIATTCVRHTFSLGKDGTIKLQLT